MPCSGAFGHVVRQAGKQDCLGSKDNSRNSPVPSNYLKKLTNTDSIWEVKVDVGRNTFRLLGFFSGRELIVLTNSFQKKSQKTPTKEIKLAETLKRDYLNRR